MGRIVTADDEAVAGDDDATPPKPRVLCAGHINWDVTMKVEHLPEPDGEQRIDHLQQSGGGSAANVATELVGLNADSVLFGSVGGDDSGALALQELDRAGIDPGHVMVANDRATSVKYLIVDDDGEVMVLSSEGANEAFGAADLDDEALGDVDHLHLTGQNPGSAGDLAALAAGQGTPVSFDPGRLLDERDYTTALGHTDLLFVNDREAAMLDEAVVDIEDPQDVTLVFKRGSEGAELRLPGRERLYAPPYDVEPVDTTGAGDAFAAGFLAACFESARGHEPEVDDGTHRGIPGATAPHFRNADLEYALEIGNVAGALATQVRGARTSLTWERIDAFLEEHRQ
ncbi:MAG: carbohydrate kinase family protein [Halopenitus sp.]